MQGLESAFTSCFSFAGVPGPVEFSILTRGVSKLCTLGKLCPSRSWSGLFGIKSRLLGPICAISMGSDLNSQSAPVDPVLQSLQPWRRLRASLRSHLTSSALSSSVCLKRHRELMAGTTVYSSSCLRRLCSLLWMKATRTLNQQSVSLPRTYFDYVCFH